MRLANASRKSEMANVSGSGGFRNSYLAKVIRHSKIRRVLIHIGLEKTGSTFLQRTLLSNRERLLEDGVLFPQSLSTPRHHVTRGFVGGEHDRLVSILLERPRTARSLLAFENEIKKTQADTLILSNELLSTSSYALAVERLKDILGDIPTTVICYLRNHAVWVESLYKEYVAGGNYRDCRDFDQFAASSRAFPDLHSIHQTWSSSDLPRSLVFRSIESFQNGSKTALLDDFLGQTDKAVRTADWVIPRGITNPSFQPLDVAKIQLLNRLLEGYPSSTYRKAYEKVTLSLSEQKTEQGTFLSAFSEKNLLREWVDHHRPLVAKGVIDEATFRSLDQRALAKPHFKQGSLERDQIDLIYDIASEFTAGPNSGKTDSLVLRGGYIFRRFISKLYRNIEDYYILYTVSSN